MFLLDTDIISYLMKERPPSALLERAAKEPADAQYTTAITVGEIGFGAFRTGRPARYLEKFRPLLSGLRVLPFDLEAAWRYAEIRAELERRGTQLAEADLRIASIALSRALVLVTHNARHFKRVPGLLLEDWAA